MAVAAWHDKFVEDSCDLAFFHAIGIDFFVFANLPKISIQKFIIVIIIAVLHALTMIGMISVTFLL